MLSGLIAWPSLFPLFWERSNFFEGDIAVHHTLTPPPSKIRVAMDDPHKALRDISPTSSKVIGLILGDVQNPYYAEIIYRLQNILFQRNYMLMQFSSSYIEEKELQFIEFCEQSHFAGLVLLSALDSDILRERIRALPFPVVLLNRFIPNLNCSTVMQDNFQCGYLAANHLLGLGHPRIAFVAGPKNSTSSMKRLDGFRQALANCFVPLEEDEIYYGNLTLEDGQRIGSEYIKELDKHPKAVIVGNDMMSIGFIDACHQNGVRIPEDLSLISFDNIRLSGLSCIDLTTVQQPIPDMCEATAEAIFQALENPDAGAERIILSPTLVIRSTTDYYRPGSEK